MFDLASRVISAMTRLGYAVDRGPGERNIVYVEGMNIDGTPNDNAPNRFNDVRMVIEFENGVPKITGIWQATSEPGKKYTENPLAGTGGAARIKFGQYRAWQVGMHHGTQEALVQTGGAVTVCRDENRDYRRDGDRQTTGFYGINQHWGYDLPENDVGGSSAGCLVGRTKAGHREFMALIKTDPRYVADQKYIFASAVIPVSAVAAGAIGVAPATSQITKGIIMEPASIRYNNPGAMWGGNDISRKWGEQSNVVLNDGKGQNNHIAGFPTKVHGAAAQIDLWRTSRYRNKPFKEAIIPWSGGNNVPSYIKLVASLVPGFTGDTVIDDAFLQGPNGIPFLKAQAWHEAGRQYPMTDAEWRQAQDMVFHGGASPKAGITKADVAKGVVIAGGVGTGAGGVVVHGAKAGWGVLEWLSLCGGVLLLIAVAYVVWFNVLPWLKVRRAAWQLKHIDALLPPAPAAVAVADLPSPRVRRKRAAATPKRRATAKPSAKRAPVKKRAKRRS